ncbi:MAG: Gfo/Idh/MocA family oxidoreductase [Blastocatellia bacterium]
MVRVAVVGAGAFGRHHVRIYASRTDVELVGVCDTNAEVAQSIASQFAVNHFTDFHKLIGKVDAVSLAVPTVSHHAIACELLEAGVHVLVEKPMARNLDEADAMISAAASGKAVLQVGQLERFNPAVTAAREVATAPRFFEAHRLSVFTPRSLDIDVVMDLMIHDIDVILSFAASEVAEIRAAGVPVVTPKVDIANARIEFENGAVANLTASRVSGDRVRKLRFFQPGEYISIDYASQETASVAVKRTEAGAPDFNAGLLRVNRGEPLQIEIEAFLSAVGGAVTQVDGSEGRRALALALDVNAKIAAHLNKVSDVFGG